MFAEGHNRLATGFLPLTFCALALAILLNGSFNRRGHTILVVKALGGIFMVLCLSITLKNYAVTHQWLLPLMYFNSIIPLLIALYIILKPSRFSPPRQYDISNTHAWCESVSSWYFCGNLSFNLKYCSNSLLPHMDHTIGSDVYSLFRPMLIIDKLGAGATEISY